MSASDHIQGEQFSYPEDMSTASSHEQHQFGRVHRSYGSNDTALLFGEAPTAPTPWPRASRTKTEPAYDQGSVTRALQARHSSTTTIRAASTPPSPE